MIAFWMLDHSGSNYDMFDLLKTQALRGLKIVAAFLPMLIAMYLLYWLGISETWVPETPRRDLITIVIMAIGMVMSLLVHTYFNKRSSK